MKFLIILFISFFSIPSYAYLDPGSGSLIIAALISLLVFVKTFFYKLKLFFLNLFKKFNKK